jgi:phosphatidylserine decarboxylase
MTERSKPAGRRLGDELNFLLTNRIPRRLANRFIGWFSKIESPLLTRASIALWRLFADLDLSESRTSRFNSLHACFTRELKPGARPIDPDPAVLTSPCDAIIGASGTVSGRELIQAKGFRYTLEELLIDPALAERYVDGVYVTLRLTSGMYHRFHAPYDGTVGRVAYIPGDSWNVNPIALERVPKLYCRNERAVIPLMLAGPGALVTLVPVAAILVASIRLHFLDLMLSAGYRGAAEIACHASFAKGEEMGWFEHGSTIIVFAPKGFALDADLRQGARIRMGRPLLRLPWIQKR